MNFDNPAAALSYIYFCNGTGNYKQMRVDRFEGCRARVVKRPGDDGEEQGEAGQDPKRGRKVYKLARAEQQFEGGHFRYFFVCLGGLVAGFPGNKYVCMTMLSSKRWRQLFPTEAWTAGPRWYCDCGTKYKAGNGVVVEIKQGEQYFYMRAPCPKTEYREFPITQEMMIGRRKLSRAEFYFGLPVCQSADTVFVTHGEGRLPRFESYERFSGLPLFSWESVDQYAEMMSME